MKIETLHRKIWNMISDKLLITLDSILTSVESPLSAVGFSQQSLGELIAEMEKKFDVEFPEDWVSEGIDKTPSDIIEVICEQKDIVR
jgi:hypothetical protein